MVVSDTVFIKAYEELQVVMFYSITTDPFV